MLKQLIEAYLWQDAACREAGEWTLVPVNFDRVGMGLPLKLSRSKEADDYSMTRGCYFNSEGRDNLDPAESNEEAMERLFDHFTVLHRILNIGGKHIMLAGGAVVGALRGTLPPENVHKENDIDIDLFFHSCSKEEAERLLELIAEMMMKKGTVVFTREPYVVTMIFERRKYQFVLRTYSSPDQILGDFDLAPSMVGYTRDLGFVATESGRFAIESNVLPVELSKFSHAYIWRVYKYVNSKAFDLVVPSWPEEDDEEPLIEDWILGDELEIGEEGVKLVGQKPYRDPPSPRESEDDSDNDEEYYDHYDRYTSRKAFFGMPEDDRLAMKNYVIALDDDVENLMLKSHNSWKNLFSYPKPIGMGKSQALYGTYLRVIPAQMNQDTLRKLRKWLHDDELFIDFVKARIGNDSAEISQIFKAASCRVEMRLKELSKKARNTQLKWKSCDKVLPVQMSKEKIRKFYSESLHRPTYAGLSSNVQLACSLVWLSSDLPRLPRQLWMWIMKQYIIPAYANHIIKFNEALWHA